MPRVGIKCHLTLTNLLRPGGRFNQLIRTYGQRAPRSLQSVSRNNAGESGRDAGQRCGMHHEKNTITINHDGALMLAAGIPPNYSAIWLATQMPVAISDLSATLPMTLPIREKFVFIFLP